MIPNIHTWFSALDWDMWGGLGQWAGAVATFIAVWVALKQTKISQDQTKEAQKQTEYSQKQAETAIQQTKLAIQQMEEARQREIEAMKPELKVKVIMFESEDSMLWIRIILTNRKPVPVYICEQEIRIRTDKEQFWLENEFEKFSELAKDKFVEHFGDKADFYLKDYYENHVKNWSFSTIKANQIKIKGKQINTEIPKNIAFNDISITDLPLHMFIMWSGGFQEEVCQNLFEIIFYSSTGEEYIASIFLICEPESEEKSDYFWSIYALDKLVDEVTEIKSDNNLIAKYTFEGKEINLKKKV